MQCYTIQYNTIQYNTIKYNTVKYNRIHILEVQSSPKLKHWKVGTEEDGVNLFQFIDKIYDRITLDP